MSDMSDWRRKADEDLTAEDLAEMRSLAKPVGLRGPLLPPTDQAVTTSGFSFKTYNSGHVTFAGNALAIYPGVEIPA